MKRGTAACTLLLLFTLAVTDISGEPQAIVADGRTVSIVYTMTLDDGTEVDSNVDGKPLAYEHGNSDFPPAVESSLEGAGPGEVREFTLPPEQAFGKVMPEAVREIELARLPEDARREGAALVISNSQGREHMIRVREINGDTAVIDFNHPLAGKAIHFKVRILAVQ